MTLHEKLKNLKQSKSDKCKGSAINVSYLDHGSLQNAKYASVFRFLDPTDDRPPVCTIGLFLTCTSKVAHFIVCQSAENEEESGENARISRN